MKLRAPDITHLKRDTIRLFTWTSKGIILTKGYHKINLNLLEPEYALDILERLEDEEELTFCQINDIKEVKEEFLEKILKK